MPPLDAAKLERPLASAARFCVIFRTAAHAAAAERDAGGAAARLSVTQAALPRG